MSKYSALVYKLPKSNDKILTYETELELSYNIEYPKFSLGFHHFIHQNKDKLNVLVEFKDKKKVYLVMNKFEQLVDDYDKSIDNITKEYFKLKPELGIIGRSFYKYWEILISFDLLQKDKSIITAHIADRGTSIQAISLFTEKLFSKNNKDDKYYSLSFKPSEITKHILPVDNSLVNQYKKEKSSKFVQNRIKRKQSRSNQNMVELFDEKEIKEITQKVDLIMAYSGYNWENKNVQEQEFHRLLLGEIIMAFKIQKKGGNFICKIYESFTKTTLKLVEVLLSVYDEIYVYKPFISRAYNSEKFLICKNFLGVDNKQIEKLELLLDALLDGTNKTKNIANIFPKFKLSDEIKNTFIKINTNISNNQLININEIIDFLNKQNYRGDTYNERRDMQIKSSEFWISRFLLNEKSLDTERNKIIEENNKIITQNQTLVKQLANNIK